MKSQELARTPTILGGGRNDDEIRLNAKAIMAIFVEAWLIRNVHTFFDWEKIDLVAKVVAKVPPRHLRQAGGKQIGRWEDVCM